MPQLEAVLRANLVRYEQDMNRAGAIANRQISSIEQGFARMNPKLGGALSILSGGLLGGLSLAAFVAGINSAVNSVARLGDVAKRLGVDTDELQRFRFAVEQTGGTAAEADEGLERFARGLSEAASGSGDLLKVLQANKVAFLDTRDQALSVGTMVGRYAEIVRNAKNPQDALNLTLIGFGRGAGGLVNALRQGEAGIVALGDRFEETGAKIDRNLIDKADEVQKRWNGVTGKIGAWLKETFVGVADAIDKIAQEARDFGVTQFGPGRVDDVEAFRRQILSMRAEVERLRNISLVPEDWNLGIQIALRGITELESKLAALIEHARQAALTRLRFGGGVSTLGAFGLHDIQPKEPSKMPNLGGPSELERTEEKIRKRIELLEAEAAAVGLGAESEATLKAQAELLNAARQAGIPLTEQTIQRINDLAIAYGGATLALNEAVEAERRMQEIQRFLGQQMIDFFQIVATGSGKAEEALKKLAQAFLSAALQAVVLGSGPLAGLFGTAQPGGKVGGFIGALFGGFRQHGGPVTPGRAYVVGERGPEVFMPRVPGTVLPSGAGGGVTVVINSRPVFQAGMTPTDMAAINAALERNKFETRDLTINAIRSSVRSDSRALQGTP